MRGIAKFSASNTGNQKYPTFYQLLATTHIAGMAHLVEFG